LPQNFEAATFLRHQKLCKKEKKEGKEFNPQFDGPARQPATTIDVEYPHKT